MISNYVCLTKRAALELLSDESMVLVYSDFLEEGGFSDISARLRKVLDVRGRLEYFRKAVYKLGRKHLRKHPAHFGLIGIRVVFGKPGCPEDTLFDLVDGRKPVEVST